MTLETAIAPSDNDRERKLALFKAIGFDKLSEPERELGLNIATRYGLDLLLKHLVLIDGRAYITRDGLLHVAHNSGKLDGIEVTPAILEDGYWRSTASVFRKDMGRPFTYSGRYPETGRNKLYGPEMAVKVAEVAALRRAFDVAAPTIEERFEGPLPAHEPAKAKTTLAEKVAEKAATVLPPEPVDEGDISPEDAAALDDLL